MGIDQRLSIDLPYNEEDTITGTNYSSYSTIMNTISLEVNKKEQYAQEMEVSVQEKKPREWDFETAISECGYGKYHYILLLATFPSATASLLAATSMSYILPSAECDLNLTSFHKGLLNAITYIGMICSAFMWGMLSDTLGRRRLLLVAHFLEFVIGVAVALSQTLETLLVFKLISGFISAAPYPMLMAYLAEIHSSKQRASIILWSGVFMACAMLLIPVWAWMIIPMTFRLELGPIILPSWKLYLLVCALPPLIAFGIVCFFPESPKFLMACGKKEEALEIFRSIYESNTGRPKDTYPVKALKDEKEKVVDSSGSKNPLVFLHAAWNQVKPLFLKPHIKHAILCFSLQMGVFISLNTIRLWLPQLFSSIINSEQKMMELGEESTPASTICQLLEADDTISNVTSSNITDCSLLVVQDEVYTNSIIVGAVTALGYLTTSFMIQQLGKKGLICTLFMISSGLCISMYWASSSLLMVIISSIYVSLMSSASTTVISVIVDLFPTTLRTMSVSLAVMFGRIGAVGGNLIFPILLDLNCTVPFFLIAAVIICTALVATMIPKSMEEEEEEEKEKSPV